MTIHEEDLENYEATTDSFKYQPDMQDCLPVCVKNILDELAERHDQPQIQYSESEIKQMSDHDPDFGSTGRLLVTNLSAEIRDYGYTVKDQTGTEFDELNNIIESSTASFPTVSVSPDYFDLIRDWDPRGSRRGKNRPHMLVPFKVNKEEVLFFDPYAQMQLRSGALPQSKRRLDRKEFFCVWDTKFSFPRYTLWIDKLEQATLEAYG